MGSVLRAGATLVTPALTAIRDVDSAANTRTADRRLAIALSQLSHRAADGYFKPVYRQLAPEYYDNDYAVAPADIRIMHYHDVDVRARQRQLASRPTASLDDILTPPLGNPEALTPEAIQTELDNNAQGILGYVVRWIDQGIGCSKVPDINGVNLMDGSIAAFLRELDERGQRDDTIVLFLSDNGSPMPRAKGTLYDAGIKTPLIVAGPGVTAGTRYQPLVSVIDLAPTILDWAGLDVPDTMTPAHSPVPAPRATTGTPCWWHIFMAKVSPKKCW